MCNINNKINKYIFLCACLDIWPGHTMKINFSQTPKKSIVINTIIFIINDKSFTEQEKTNKPYHCHVQIHSLIYLPVYLFIYHYLFILNFCLLWGRILFLFCFSISPTLVQFTCKLLKLFKFNSNSRTKMLWKFRICEMKRIKRNLAIFFSFNNIIGCYSPVIYDFLEGCSENVPQ